MASSQIETFGTLPSGETVSRVRISGGGLTAHVLTYGAVIQDLRLEGHTPSLVLGFDRLQDYLAHSPYFGATPGRCANRIDGGRFTLDGTAYQLALNEKGIGHLHGGSDGTGVRNWQITDHAPDRVTLSITDPDGRAGYPGNARITAAYTLLPGGVLSVVYETVTDRPTLANVCQHSYFNLDGADDINGHILQLAAEHYLPVDDRLIPTGEIRAVAGTAFDFRSPAPMGRSEDGKAVVFDHNFCLSPDRVEKRSVGRITSPVSHVALEIATTEPGVQFYAGGYVNVPVEGHDGRRYGANAGFCMETQVWPDAINHASFPSAVLRPGDVLRQETDYIFTRG
ncbi:aldose epimerase family protein [Rhizobium halophytocola]|uniref:Aldose 1-epimerase n=1 Tax=Rhizobium halophytocola TaxID=735519 RepID=A0ABS4E1Y5_9HYPH|nr:aldose epimerase family protein [Rhizobium halophytocola]MBP1851947.1 aldose 1-epimerase [Rhizobium halophytocola]